jgi:hypothetical protein
MSQTDIITQVSEEDKSILGQMGFNLSALIGFGACGSIFNGICNKKALL